MPHKAPLLTSVAQNPLLLDIEAKDFFRDATMHIVAHEHAEELMNQQASDDDFWPTDRDDWMHHYRPYKVVDGVLQIPVFGVLLNRFAYQFGRWATGYTYIERAVKRGMADPDVRAIALICDSPGGEVAGCFELTDYIYEFRGQKPIRAFAADMSASAAYSLASSADQIAVTRSGRVGSVGVVTMHIDWSSYLEKEGIKVSLIHAGDYKVDGNPYESLSDDVRERIQQRIDKTYAVFTSTVARNRGMEDDDVRATEALTYDADEAIDVGFADIKGSLEEQMAVFVNDILEPEEDTMSNKNTNTNAEDTATTPAQPDQAALSAARTEGATAERTRINAILGCDEAANRPKAAMSVAMKTSMTFEEATAFLKDLLKESAKASDDEEDDANDKDYKKDDKAQDPFSAAMEASGNPDVGADNGSDSDDDQASDDDKAAAAILNASAASTGLPRQRAN